MTGEYLVSKLRIAARARGVSVNVFVAPLTRNPAGFLQSLSYAAEPRAHTVARIEALIAGKPLPELQRQIIVTVPHSTWCKIEANARAQRRKMADVAASVIINAVDRL